MEWVARRIAFTKKRFFSNENILDEENEKKDEKPTRRHTDASFLRTPMKRIDSNLFKGTVQRRVSDPYHFEKDTPNIFSDRGLAPYHFRNDGRNAVSDRGSETYHFDNNGPNIISDRGSDSYHFDINGQNTVSDTGSTISSEQKIFFETIEGEINSKVKIEKRDSINLVNNTKKYSRSERIELWRKESEEKSSVIINEAEKLGLSVKDVPWETSSNNTLIKVDASLFPVDRDFVSEVSTFFEELFDSKEKEDPDFVMVELEEYEDNYVFKALKFIYSQANEEITDENIASNLLLSEEFKICRLRHLCKTYLQNSTTCNPYIAIQLATMYELDDVIDKKCFEISKQRGVESSKEFALLDIAIQNKILKYSLQRYANAVKVLSQFDVHLCPHHADMNRHETCCFRSATYNTIEGRTFLVKMEKPELHVTQTFQKRFGEQCGLMRTPTLYEE